MQLYLSKNWKTVSWTKDETGYRLRVISRSPIPCRCPKCGIAERIISHGTRRKIVRDFPFSGEPVFIELRVPRYFCKQCGATFALKVQELESGMRITSQFADYIFRQCATKSHSEISRETGVGRSAIYEIHVRRIEKHETQMRFPTPEVLGMDGVYVERKERCILTDIEKRRVVGLYESIRGMNVVKYLLDLPDRDKVKVVTMDMSRSFRNAVKTALPAAKIVIDKYHVQRHAKTAIDRFLSLHKPQRRGNRHSEESNFNYRRDRFLLYSRRHKLNETQREQLKSWGDDIPDLLLIYDLKEKFHDIWQYGNRSAAETAFDEWRKSIPRNLKFIFKEILSAFKNWRTEILNYFDYRVTNAFTEASNRRIKIIQKVSGGCSFWVVRAKILWREYEKLDEADRLPPLVLHDHRYVIPKKSQRILRLRQAYERASEMFGLMFPSSEWLDRFDPYISLLIRT